MTLIPTIEEFRKYIGDKLVKKGIKPPKSGSKKEEEIYQRWIRGRKKLQS